MGGLKLQWPYSNCIQLLRLAEFYEWCEEVYSLAQHAHG